MTTHVVIIGGGPAGLATAACLAREQVPYTVLERGDTPLAALRRLDPEMQLITPTRFSRLPGMTLPAGTPQYMQFGNFVRELEAWRAANELAVVTGATVERVAPTSAGFEVHYRLCGTPLVAMASHVVSATGFIGQPQLPVDFDARTFSLPWAHSLDVRTADLAAARRLFVVGAGMSAAEIVERWLHVRTPDDRAWLSTRGRVWAAPSTILGVDLHWFLWLPEHLPPRLGPVRLAPKRDAIIGRTLLRALHDDSVTRVPVVARYERDAVVLADDRQLEPDFTVFATGFRYADEHLGSLVEHDADGAPIVDRHSASIRAANLYVLGLRSGRSIASSALRGISRDAEHVARRIASHP
jgi:putative flavoprotein involved in K+ transport